MNLWKNGEAVTTGNQDEWLTMDAGAYSIIFMRKLWQKNLHLLEYLQFSTRFSHRPHYFGFHIDTQHICFVLLLYTTGILLRCSCSSEGWAGRLVIWMSLVQIPASGWAELHVEVSLSKMLNLKLLLMCGWHLAWLPSVRALWLSGNLSRLYPTLAQGQLGLAPAKPPAIP